jgi:signal transduction histidine kinase
MPTGQGIGLAVVQDIVRAYGGQLLLQQSAAGGLRVVLEFSPVRA